MAPPTLTLIGPATLAADDAFVLEVTSVPALVRVSVALTFPGIPTTELVANNTTFTAPYERGSSVAVIANGYRYTVRRPPAWPDTPQLIASAVNSAGETNGLVYDWPPIATVAAPALTTLVPFAASGSPALSGSGAPSRNLASLLALFDRIFPEDYLQGMKSGAGPGYELFRAFARVAERASLAVQRFEDGATFLFSEGPAFSQGTVEFYRQNAGAGAVTVRAWTMVADELGRNFFTTADAVFGGAALGPVSAPIIAAVPSYQWDLPGVMLAPSGQSVPGPITHILRLLEIPDFGDPSIQVRNITPTTGGRDGQLDLNAMDRGIFRTAGEGDDHIRYRARALPDVVTPGAIRRITAGFLDAYHIAWEFIETARPEYQTFYDAEDGGEGYDPNLFTYDDPRGDTPFFNRWLDASEDTRCFLIAMDPGEPVDDVGGQYDDAFIELTELESRHRLGGRSATIYDIADGEADYATAAYDGGDAGLDALYAGLWDAIQRARPAGVTAGFVLRGS